jgi:ABC-2 type transport system permease protein
MKKIFVIIKREYLTRVRTRAFLIGTIASPLFMLALIMVPAFLATRGGGERNITVLDQSGDPGLFQALNQRIGDTEGDPYTDNIGRRRNIDFKLQHAPVPPDRDIDEVRREHYEKAGEDSDTAYVVLRAGVLEGAEPEYYAKTTSDFAVNVLEDGISSAITERKLVRAGVDPSKVNSYTQAVDLKTRKIGPEGESEDSGRALFFVGLVMLFFLYMTILLYGVSVMRGVIEEKQSRIVEVIISSVKPTQMMMGKLIGIGLVGLTQYVIWVLAAVAISYLSASLFASSGLSIPQIPASLLIYFIVYFVLGYFLFATLYAMVGAMVSTEEEAQQVQFPVTMLIIVPMLLFSMVMNNPNGGASIVLSMIPFFAPTLMVLRVAMVNPPVWQVLLSMLIMVITILGAVWFAAKIYRVGILMYGKRPSIAELGRWLRYT